MSDEFEYEVDYLEEERPRDRMVDVAKDALLTRYFPSDGQKVYYGRQLEVWLEREFFHWITKKALNELVAEGKIGFSPEATGRFIAHFYWPLRHRYQRRQIAETVGIIKRFSQPNFTSAVGSYGEILADAGFARIGFRVLASNIREVDGRDGPLQITTSIGLLSGTVLGMG
jgi:hypothetical protein